MLKNILLFIGLLLPWFLSSLIPIDVKFYQSLNLPIIAPPSWLFGVVWPVIYLFITISIYQIIKNYGAKEVPKSYYRTLLINYLFNQSFTIVFFALKSPFLGFVSTVGTFISSLFLYEETTKLLPKSNKYLNPYMLWGLYATVLALTIYALNAG